ncbi:MAG: hypothetical protein JSS29_01705 [Proteobacteria bacterium]|nr:hypothetical protein [Pseudomonadota bacterium]
MATKIPEEMCARVPEAEACLADRLRALMAEMEAAREHSHSGEDPEYGCVPWFAYHRTRAPEKKG